MSPATGLYTAFAAMLLYAIFGTSRQLKVTTSSTMSAMSAAHVAQTGGPRRPARRGHSSRRRKLARRAVGPRKVEHIVSRQCAALPVG
jgi:MFS superfamily sulfate permease-like transporter